MNILNAKVGSTVYFNIIYGGELCSLTYDLTVPFARFVAMNGLTSFRRYQIAKVYRRDNPSKGRYREFYQCDFDIAGQFELMGPDFEIVKILTELLDELDIGDYEVKLNHRKLLDGMMEICGVPPQKFGTICSSIDKLDKQSFEQIKKEMVEEKGLTAETADKIGEYVKQRGSPLELMFKLKQDGSKLLENQGSVIALNELEILFKALEKSKCSDKVIFDLSLARGLDYYTGVIFEAVFKGSTKVGSIASGGRYDNLIGKFGTKQVLSVGVSLGIERVFDILEEAQQNRNQQTVRATETQVLVSVMGDDLIQAAELASALWNAKIKTEYLVHKRQGKHTARMSESRIPWRVIVGEKEIAEGTVNLKNTETQEQFEVISARILSYRLVHGKFVRWKENSMENAESKVHLPDTSCSANRKGRIVKILKITFHCNEIFTDDLVPPELQSASQLIDEALRTADPQQNASFSENRVDLKEENKYSHHTMALSLVARRSRLRSSPNEAENRFVRIRFS
ncbi:hypothetical protein QQ045_026740 [Rhodiola kirilowii]